MFSKTTLALNVLTAAIAGFLMNIAIYQLAPLDENRWGCGTVDYDYEYSQLPDLDLSDLALEGEQIFKANCTSCHAINQKVVGPALKNVIGRWPSREALVEFIRYPEKTIRSGKVPYATALYEQYQAAGFMQNNDYLSDENIEAILAYLEESSQPYQKVEEIATVID